MNKQAILDVISQALDGMGMDSLGGDEFDEDMGMEGTNEVPVWSRLEAGTLGQTGGAIHDKSALMGVDKMSKPPQVDNYGMPAAGDQEEMMSALGLV